MPLSSINIYTLKQIRTKRHRYDLEDHPITSPLICYKVLQYLLDLKSEPVEKFGIISLSSRNKIIGIHIIGTDSIDRLCIEPRECLLISFMILGRYDEQHQVDHHVPQPSERRARAQSR